MCILNYLARRANAPYYTVICGLSGSIKFFHIVSQTARSSEKLIEQRISILIFSTTYSWNISHSKKNSASYYYKCENVFRRLHIKYPWFLSAFNKTWAFSIYFQKSLKYQVSLRSVQWKLSRSMRAEGRTERTDMTNLMVACWHFAGAHRK
jgi:hypothetical protein